MDGQASTTDMGETQESHVSPLWLFMIFFSLTPSPLPCLKLSKFSYILVLFTYLHATSIFQYYRSRAASTSEPNLIHVTLELSYVSARLWHVLRQMNDPAIFTQTILFPSKWRCSKTYFAVSRVEWSRPEKEEGQSPCSFMGSWKLEYMTQGATNLVKWVKVRNHLPLHHHHNCAHQIHHQTQVSSQKSAFLNFNLNLNQSNHTIISSLQLTNSNLIR